MINYLKHDENFVFITSSSHSSQEDDIVGISEPITGEPDEGTGIFDDDELWELIRLGEEARARGDVMSSEEVKRRLNYPDGKAAELAVNDPA